MKTRRVILAFCASTVLCCDLIVWAAPASAKTVNQPVFTQDSDNLTHSPTNKQQPRGDTTHSISENESPRPQNRMRARIKGAIIYEEKTFKNTGNLKNRAANVQSRKDVQRPSNRKLKPCKKGCSSASY